MEGRSTIWQLWSCAAHRNVLPFDTHATERPSGSSHTNKNAAQCSHTHSPWGAALLHKRSNRMQSFLHSCHWRLFLECERNKSKEKAFRSHAQQHVYSASPVQSSLYKKKTHLTSHEFTAARPAPRQVCRRARARSSRRPHRHDRGMGSVPARLRPLALRWRSSPQRPIPNTFHPSQPLIHTQLRIE